MRWPTWLHRNGRTRAVEEAAAAIQAAEHAAARQRVIDLAHRDKWHVGNAPTAAQRPLTAAGEAAHRPLLTAGKAARGHDRRRARSAYASAPT